MGARFRSWRQQIKQHRVAIGVVAIIFVVVIVLIIAGYWFDWTGFNGYNKVTITHTISGTNAGTVTKTEEYQPGKGLWDWLQLLGVLAIPVVVGFGAVWFTTRQGKVADAENTDNQRETALQAYIDKMSELLLHEKLRESTVEDDEVRNVARARTLSVLTQLDTKRKGSIFHFLHETHLIGIINLDGADLSGIEANFIDLSGAMLSGVNLSGADLGEADLSEADLSHAKLNYANLFSANLTNANLSYSMLVGAYLFTANLRGANLDHTILSEADLTAADLSEATFDTTIIGNANLTQTNFKNAKIRGMFKSQLEKIKGKPENS